MEVVFLAVALSADAVVFGLSFGVKDIKIPLYSLFLMTAVGFLTVGGGLLLGEIMFSLLPVGESLGAFILVGLGMWLICDSDDGAKEVINHPEKIDIDNSRIIEPVEAIITGFALSVDSVSVCLGYGAAGKNSVVLPVLVTDNFLIWWNNNVKKNKTENKGKLYYPYFRSYYNDNWFV